MEEKVKSAIRSLPLHVTYGWKLQFRQDQHPQTFSFLHFVSPSLLPSLTSWNKEFPFSNFNPSTSSPQEKRECLKREPTSGPEVQVDSIGVDISFKFAVDECRKEF